MKRKKRLEKGIDSLKKAIEEHEEKLQDAIEGGREELANYYSGEIHRLEGTKERKKKQLEKS